MFLSAFCLKWEILASIYETQLSPFPITCCTLRFSHFMEIHCRTCAGAVRGGFTTTGLLPEPPPPPACPTVALPPLAVVEWKSWRRSVGRRLATSPEDAPRRESSIWLGSFSSSHMHAAGWTSMRAERDDSLLLLSAQRPCCLLITRTSRLFRPNRRPKSPVILH